MTIMSNPLYRELYQKSVDNCASTGVNKAWLWEEVYAYEVATATLDWVNENVGMISNEARLDLLKHLGLSQDLNILMLDTLNLEIAKELLTQVNPSITDKEISAIYSKCNHNPWNAPILYSIMQAANKGTV